MVPCPVVWYLSGLTCTHANVMEKGEYRRMAAELGLIVVCPDTSPRGADVPDEEDDWQFGSGAGFYVDATEAPYAANYRMYSYVVDELPKLIAANFPADRARQSIFGHSMGGHGALTIALKNPDRFASCSAFAPIVHPATADWSSKAFARYLGPNEAAWRALRCLPADRGRPPLRRLSRRPGQGRRLPAGRAAPPGFWKRPAARPASRSPCACRRATTTPTSSSPASWKTTCAGTRHGSARAEATRNDARRRDRRAVVGYGSHMRRSKRTQSWRS
jgi:pimeloyl-ACP methyl ester carboxylesterase